MRPVTLRSARLVLDQPRADDVDEIARLCQDPEFERYLTIPWPYERRHAVGFVEEYVPSGWETDREYTWALRRIEDGPLLGGSAGGPSAATSASGSAASTGGRG